MRSSVQLCAQFVLVLLLFGCNGSKGSVRQDGSMDGAVDSVASGEPADGNVIVFGNSDGFLEVSTDFGVTWTLGKVSNGWYSVAVTADGSKVFASSHDGYVDGSPAS